MKQHTRIIGIILTIVGILAVPLIAMQFTNEVQWTISDFVVMGGLLGAVGLAYECAARMTGNTAYRGGVALALITSLMLVWINLAVGIIGDEDNPLNILYFGVLLVGLTGVIFSQFKAKGMSRALFLTAGVQLLVPVIAFFVGRPTIDSTELFMGFAGIFMLSAFFSLLYVGSALLFVRAYAVTHAMESL